MKITICSSINFSPQIIEIKKKLEEKGHQIGIPYFTEKILNNEVSYEEFIKTKEEKGDISLRNIQSIDLIKRHKELIENSDAILVLNLTKNKIEGYIGGNTLMEMGFAHIYNKKIFLFNEIPLKSERMHYIDEILDMKPVIINCDLDKIK